MVFLIELGYELGGISLFRSFFLSELLLVEFSFFLDRSLSFEEVVLNFPGGSCRR